MTNTPANNNAPLDKVHQDALDILMLDAIQNGNIDRINLAVVKGANTNAFAQHKQWKGKENYSRPALHLAYEFYNSAVFEALLAAGANVDIRDKDGLTVMMRAAEDKNIDAVRLCLKYKADPLVKDNAGRALLTLARSAYTSVGEDAAGKMIVDMLLTALPDMRGHFDQKAPKDNAPEEETQAVTLMPQIRLKKPAKGGPNGFNLE